MHYTCKYIMICIEAYNYALINNLNYRVPYTYHNHSKLYKFTIHNMEFIAYNLVSYIKLN